MTISPQLPPEYRLAARREIGSTNDEAARLAAAGAPDGTVVWATAQTAGRGRGGRTWASGSGNLYCSILLRPRVPPALGAQLGFVAALAVGDLVASELDPAHVRLKWPNDVLVRGHKISGILLEAAAGAAGLDRLTVGIGVNLVHFPTGTEAAATSVLAETGRTLAPGNALPRLVCAFDRWRRLWEADGFAPIRRAWLTRSWRLGEEIRVRAGEGALIGRFQDIDPGGSLVLEMPGGIERRIAAGEVFPALP